MSISFQNLFILLLSLFVTSMARAVVTYEGTEGTVSRIFSICTQCHIGDAAPNGVRLDSYENILLEAQLANSRVQLGIMPPTGGLPDELRELMQAWIDDGIQEFAAPQVSNLSVGFTSSEMAEVMADVIENGIDTLFQFEFGTDSQNLEFKVASTPESPEGTGGDGTFKSISADLESLMCETRYFYRVVATNDRFDPVFSDIAEFTTLACGNMNVGPRITSIPVLEVREGSAYEYQLTVDDPDDLNNGFNLTFQLIDSPDNMSISDTGLITWSPGPESPSPVEVLVSVMDGGENGAEAATQNFAVSIVSERTQDPTNNTSENKSSGGGIVSQSIIFLMLLLFGTHRSFRSNEV